MNCRKARQLINLRLDRRLREGDRLALEGHLASCEACKEEAEGLSRSLALVEGLPWVSPPSTFTSIVMASIRLQPTAPKTLRMGWLLAPFLGFLGVLGLLLSQGSVGWLWDVEGLAALVVQPGGLEELANLLIGLEAWGLVGLSLLFIALSGLLVQLLRQEISSYNGWRTYNGHARRA